MTQLEVFRRFTGSADFEAYHGAVKFLVQCGFSVGPMQGPEPIGVLLGAADIGKWRTLSSEDIADLHGRLWSNDFRHGPVYLSIRPDAPAAVFEALAGPAAGEGTGEPPAITPDPDAELNAVIATLPPMHKASLLTIARQLAECSEPITGINLILPNRAGSPAAPARSIPASASFPQGNGAGDPDHDARHAVEGKPEGLMVGAVN